MPRSFHRPITHRPIGPSAHRPSRLVLSLSPLLGLALLTLLTLPGLAQRTATLVVLGKSDPWLAGMPNGSTASSGDVAPDESPVLVTGLTFQSGDTFTFAATGTVSYSPGSPASAPDGQANNLTSHSNGSQNGISNVTAPFDALLGVFLGPGQPDASPAPGALDFSAVASRDYLTLLPAVQQVFFIGDGLTSTGSIQHIIAPAGATRLFLGTMDGYGWYDNIGQFNLGVTDLNSAPVPETSTTVSLGLLLALGLGGLVVAGRRRRA